MKKLMFALLALVLTSSLSLAQSPSLYGYALSGVSKGMYQFSADDSGQLTATFLNGGVGESSGAGCYSNGKYYMLSQFKIGNTVYANSLYTYDAETWSQINFADVDVNLVATTMTFNPQDGKIYGCFTTGSGYKFGTINTTNGTVTNIATLSTSYAVLAADAQGRMYAITAQGILLQVDPATGNTRSLGQTGLTPNGLQDGCIDLSTGTFYWAAYGTTADGLYTVNTSNAAITKVGSWGSSKPQLVGIYSTSTAADVENSDPTYVDNFQLNFEQDELTGTVEFDMPTKDYDGQELKGDLTYYLEIDEQEVQSGNSTPGAHVSLRVSVTEGIHKFGACAGNKAGKGPLGTITRYIGNDTPKGVEHFTATKQGDGTVSLTWQAVTEGVNGGYIDAPSITYTIVRYPDEVDIAQNLAATECIDNVPVTNIGAYYYTIVAANRYKSSEVVTSNQVALGTTEPIVPPYNRKFNDGTGMAYYTAVDANGDGITWTEDEKHVFYMKPDDSTIGDDWLFAPALRLSAETMYKVSATIMSPNPNFYETFEVCYGTEPSPEAMTHTIVAKTQVNETYNLEEWITPEADGVYYIGIHAMNPTTWALYILDLGVGAGESLRGPAAGVAKATAAPLGAIGATVAFTCPTKTITGKELTTLTRAEVLNTITGLTIGAIDNPQVGGTYEIADPSPVEGLNEYVVTCSSPDGNGRGAEASCWVGIDIPSAPQNITWRQVGDQAVIIWDEPVNVGMHGGYVDVTELKYNVWNLNTYERIASEWSGRTYTDTPVITARQESLSYGVYALNSKGVGGGYSSNFSAFGTPYDTPYSDSFANARLTTSPWILDRIYGGSCGWSLSDGGTNPALDPQDKDGGLLVYTAGANGAARLNSPLVAINCLSKPVLSFWACIPQSVSTLKVQVTNDSGLTPWVDALVLTPGEAGKWTEYTIDLTPYLSYDHFQFGFTAYSTGASSEQILVDNVRVFNNVDYDLAVAELLAPEEMDADESDMAIVRVMNTGHKTAEGYTVEFYLNDRLVDTATGVTLKAGEETVYNFDFSATRQTGPMVLKAQVAYYPDEGPANNSKSVEVYIRESAFPAPQNLTGQHAQDANTLQWEAPTGDICQPVEQGCEDWESWSVGGIQCTFDDQLQPTGEEIIDEGYIGDFKVIDGDHRYTQYMASGMTLAYPNRGQGMACQVFDVAQYGYTQSSIVGAHTGNKMLVFWASPVQNDDYLILPELSPVNRRISFWAKSASDKYGLETFEIMTSSTGNNRGDFRSFQRVTDVPAGYLTEAEKGYTYYEFDLPEDTRYVAIHYDAKDVLALFIDDIAYTPAVGVKGEVLGYNVYRNDERVNNRLVTDLGYEDVTDLTGDIRYNVTAVYEQGESNYSNAYSFVTYGPTENIPADFVGTDYLAEGYFYTMGITYLTDVPMQVYFGQGKDADKVYFYTLFPNMFDGTKAPVVGTLKDNIITVPRQHFYRWYYEYEDRQIDLYLSAGQVMNGKMTELDDDLHFRIEDNGDITPVMADGMRHAYVGAFDSTGQCWVYNADIIFHLAGDGVGEIAVERPLPDAIYDLQGRRVTTPIQGVNIRGGKKWMSQ